VRIFLQDDVDEPFAGASGESDERSPSEALYIDASVLAPFGLPSLSGSPPRTPSQGERPPSGVALHTRPAIGGRIGSPPCSPAAPARPFVFKGAPRGLPCAESSREELCVCVCVCVCR